MDPKFNLFKYKSISKSKQISLNLSSLLTSNIKEKKNKYPPAQYLLKPLVLFNSSSNSPLEITIRRSSLSYKLSSSYLISFKDQMLECPTNDAETTSQLISAKGINFIKLPNNAIVFPNITFQLTLIKSLPLSNNKLNKSLISSSEFREENSGLITISKDCRIISLHPDSAHKRSVSIYGIWIDMRNVAPTLKKKSIDKAINENYSLIYSYCIDFIKNSYSIYSIFSLESGGFFLLEIFFSGMRCEFIVDISKAYTSLDQGWIVNSNGKTTSIKDFFDIKEDFEPKWFDKNLFDREEKYEGEPEYDEELKEEDIKNYDAYAIPLKIGSCDSTKEITERFDFEKYSDLLKRNEEKLKKIEEKVDRMEKEIKGILNILISEGEEVEKKEKNSCEEEALEKKEVEEKELDKSIEIPKVIEVEIDSDDDLDEEEDEDY